MKIVKLEKSLTEQAYDILLDKICTGELASGERLNQDELPARPTKPRDFKSLVSTIPPRGHVLGGANIAIVDAV